MALHPKHTDLYNMLEKHIAPKMPIDHEFTAGQFDDYPATAISTGKMCQDMCEPNVAKHFFALFGVFRCFYQLPYLPVGILFLQ